MARKRFVTSDISIDEKIADIAAENPVAALMWPWFITGFDDWGRMEAVPVKIKLSIFPAFPYTAKDIKEAIDLYDKYGIVHKYEVDGKEYIAIEPEKYYKYQTYIRGEKREKDGSNCPPPPNPPWGNAKDSAEEQTEHDRRADARTCTQVSADERNCIPSPSPSPSPSKDIYKSMHGAEAAPCQPTAPPIITLTLNDKTEYPVTEEQVKEWAKLYPAVDVMQELRKMKGWLDANPSRRKTKKGILRFINSWLSKEQDRGSYKARASHPAFKNYDDEEDFLKG